MAHSVLELFDKVTVMADFAADLERFDILSCNVDTVKNSVNLYLSGQGELISPRAAKQFIVQQGSRP